MSICIIGLGYVGLTTIVGLADANDERFIGIESDYKKLSKIKKKIIPFSEPGLDEKLEINHSKMSFYEALNDLKEIPDIFFICVGTPGTSTGNLEMTSIFNLVSEICGMVKKYKKKGISIVIRSTVPLGSLEAIENDIAKNFSLMREFMPGLVYNPEFLREGNAVEDFMAPEVIVIGSNIKKSCSSISNLYKIWEDKIFLCGLKEAEIIKTVNNTWHALKVTFANEIGTICEKNNINVGQVMAMFKADKKLNISSAYLNPGFVFGGSCL